MWNNPRLDVFANVASHSLAIINMSRSLILHDEDIPEACWRQVEISSENQKCLKKKKNQNSHSVKSGLCLMAMLS